MRARRPPNLLLAVPLGLAVVLFAAATAATAAPAGEGKMTVERIEYRGWKNNLRLDNGAAELIVTLDVGPRILSYRLKDGANVFKEFADHLGKTGEADWMIRGGHRLWAGPEDPKRTYVPDNGPVASREISPGVVRFTPGPEAASGLQKEIDLRLEPSGSRVTVVHRITNVGAAATELAPWALSVMAPGGVEIIPLPPKNPHPGASQNARSPADFAAGQSLVLWPFFDFQDPRWTFGTKYLTLRQGQRGPTKIGLDHRMGWVGYLNGGTLFVKRFEHREGATYPDRGVNFETFSNEDMLEVESLGPLILLAPGATVEHTETWALFGGVADVRDEASIDAQILPKLGAR